MTWNSRAFVVALWGLLAAFASPALAQEQAFDLERIQRATVFIMQATGGNEPTITCVGSGTIVSRDGLILSNAHNTAPNPTCPGDTLIIALSVRLDEPPVPIYRAELAQADSGLDLALLRITRQNDGRVIDPSSLSLPFVELGDSAGLSLDDTITTVGYPDLGDSAVSVARGTVSGFTAEPSGGDKSWIKTSASIPGAMSGGGVYDAQGRLIGVPTTAPVVGLSPEARCVTMQDTNRDGVMNSSDTCVPVGGFINSLRPASFVRPLRRAKPANRHQQRLPVLQLRQYDAGNDLRTARDDQRHPQPGLQPVTGALERRQKRHLVCGQRRTTLAERRIRLHAVHRRHFG